MSQDTDTTSENVALVYFGDAQAKTVEAINERIFPGAIEAGVVYYIDKAVGGYSTNLQRIYRLGLTALERHCDNNYGTAFVDLDAAKQDELIRRFLGPEVAEPTPPEVHPKQEQILERRDKGTEHIEDKDTRENIQDEDTRPSDDEHVLQHFFAVVREHTIEGYFCDPAYGGNRNAVGWRLVGFPGTQWGYTAEQMKPGYDAKQIPIMTLSDLRKQLKTIPNQNSRFNESN